MSFKSRRSAGCTLTPEKDRECEELRIATPVQMLEPVPNMRLWLSSSPALDRAPRAAESVGSSVHVDANVAPVVSDRDRQVLRPEAIPVTCMTNSIRRLQGIAGAIAGLGEQGLGRLGVIAILHPGTAAPRWGPIPGGSG